MRRPSGLILALLVPLLAMAASSANTAPLHRAAAMEDFRCGAATDLIVQALERLAASTARADLTDADQLLHTSTDLCSQYGEAWYYRSLVEARLGNAAKADYAMRQAKQFPSDALSNGFNPFVLATPDSRGVTITSAEAPAAPPGTAPSGPPQKWALVIGISRFSDPGVHPLNFTTKDADAFAAALKDPAIGHFAADNVRELTDAEATAPNIKQQMNWIARHAAANDMVVIYVATHGSPRSVDSVAGVNYLVTYDTKMFDAGHLDEDAMYATAFPMVELANAVATRMKSLRTLVVLDTCYSAGAFASGSGSAKAASPTPQMLQRMSQGTGRIVMAASRADEASLESPALGHGYFTYYLLQALKTSGGKTPLSQLFAGVANDVSKKAESAGAHQHPTIYRSSEEADFTLSGTAAVAGDPRSEPRRDRQSNRRSYTPSALGR